MAVQSEDLTPILIIGFNRPRTLSTLLGEIEKLESRNVWISIDGPKTASDVLAVKSTLDMVQIWTKNSKHVIRIIERKINLGIYSHCLFALNEFFGAYEVGLILEDDIQFDPVFVNFIDEHHLYLKSGKYWSICGHNPVSDLTDTTINEDIQFSLTNIHTIWGWAAGRKAINDFLYFKKMATSEQLDLAVTEFARSMTRDPFLRLGVRKVWKRKSMRALDSDSGGGWDNYWVLAGWNSGLPSLMPNFSLTRERPKQLEGQSHKHASTGKSWDSLIGIHSVHEEINEEEKFSDVPKLRVWGITRIYCWLYFVRLARWSPDVVH